jgi:hypothetical protein
MCVCLELVRMCVHVRMCACVCTSDPSACVTAVGLGGRTVGLGGSSPWVFNARVESASTSIAEGLRDGYY